MPHARRFQPLFVSAAVFALFLAGCTTTPKAPTPRPAPAPTGQPPPTDAPAVRPAANTPARAQPSRPPTPIAPSRNAFREIVARLARQLRVPPESIALLSVEEIDWPDACLGLAAEGEICASVMTPGFALSVEVGGDRYTFRTDIAAERIRLAEAPPADVGEALLVWRDTHSFDLLVVGTERIAFGPRGRPLLAVTLPATSRVAELQSFLAMFAPLEARTPAGEISLLGLGGQRATPVQGRILAEWARLLLIEAKHGFDGPAADRALVYRQEGGIAGTCDMLVVGRTGTASAYDCRGETLKLLATTRLEPAELEALYGWLDTFEPFAWPSDDPGATAAADALATTLELEAQGVDPVTPEARDEMVAFVGNLARRLAADG